MTSPALAVLLSLMLATGPLGSITSDAVGNRTQVATPPATTSYTHNTLNQYTVVGGVTLTYDPNGNLTNDGTRTYTYDAENRLVGSSAVGSSVTYTYDAFGRRIAKTVNGTTTRFLYDGDQLLEERSASGAFLTAYLYGPGIDELLLRYTNTNQLLIYHQNALGSTQFLLDWSGVPVDGATYDAYGTPSGPSAVGNRFLFTGREYDTETGLYYYRARYYSPSLGRFLQREPTPTDFNSYRYVLNNPTSWIDPWGLTLFSPQPPALNGSDLLGPRGPVLPIDIPIAGPQGLSDWIPPFQNPLTGPDLLPGPAIGTEAGQKLQKSACGNSTEGVGPGVLKVGGSQKQGAQDKKLSPKEIKKLKEKGFDIEGLKGIKKTGGFSLYKDAQGNILIKPPGGIGPGEPTGLNINQL